MSASIRKAIIPVAGFGTRFLPATKAQPKEMLPIVDKPVIQYIVEEAVASGITDIIFVTGQNKRAIEDHFDRNFELEYRLNESGKKKQLDEVRAISELCNFFYVRQKQPLGDGHAILQAKDLVGDDEPVAVLFGDDIIDAKRPALRQMMDVYERYDEPVIAVMRVPKGDKEKYGIVEAKRVAERISEISSLVEKPKPNTVKSNLAITGKYIITPEVFQALVHAKPGKDGEIRLIDAFRALVHTRKLYAYEFEGRRYDCGNKLQFLEATIDYGLRHPEVMSGLKRYLKGIKF
ncbi:MAG: UTP--glucose-1-phosphate uridylyltransferase [Candidatus Yonathbacteria bacterium CG_4_10_14_3_um_filter_47_65]|uniref:UTP--glucose-1-phosphate uridylyltransferase n=2 Tax=Parcubacteria group TaxID=1794811 RepID=A0A2M8D880_9BACT|nr:MAG: UTP--glucose-1-phosphate uridylyltransferase [Candidatus Nomurabacteria bacterium CG1_02_47_685]PIP04134.1 MAG: UTP--glucose-1-phosphate uridylyltransferase [Candidatus Yonathbacteria bacterium CG23_combo_of_CG06-09_8_20_14_all_46_18]PIQ31267.1 MAG: UTP--glucose-1-phosphate uridylyltransferase [Candidatus Yonathbacteria bacterium CG17_big_fil_post_rev_8_21_14_2_50_46_19]PIX56520.1 MAG: UTP--glucose-1-phosphate uridylyltransferase [Candidatus Yonathbacteria bacterium CG_4_10_14_3_um_filte